jgi:protein-L-isoaspartate(D-aspartate) O-methyltransferase
MTRFEAFRGWSATIPGLPMTTFAVARQKMVDGQVRPRDVTDVRIVDAMSVVPREAFVPPHLQAMAYMDLDLDLSGSGGPKRFLIRPAVAAKMLQAAGIKDTDTVLVASSAPGYISAVVARLAGQVIATEADPVQEATARKVLSQLRLGNVSFKPAAAADGCPQEAPFDVIFLDGATEITPDRLVSQLKEGGRLVGIYATSTPPRATIVTRSHGDFGYRALFDASSPVLAGLERPPAFVF